MCALVPVPYRQGSLLALSQARHVLLPGCMSYGATPEEAMRHLREVAGLSLKAMNDMGVAWPPVNYPRPPSGTPSPSFWTGTETQTGTRALSIRRISSCAPCWRRSSCRTGLSTPLAATPWSSTTRATPALAPRGAARDGLISISAALRTPGLLRVVAWRAIEAQIANVTDLSWLAEGLAEKYGILSCHTQ